MNCLGKLLVAVLLLLAQKQQAAVHAYVMPQPSCESELQVVMCADIPVTEVRDRHACCRMYRPQPALPRQISVADLDETAYFAAIPRPDLNQESGISAQPIDWHFGTCTASVQVDVPTFPGPRSAAVVQQQTVPELNSTIIEAVKQRALSQLPESVREAYLRIRHVNESSGFTHPGTYVGPAEVALLQQRLAAGVQPQTAAKMSLMTGFGVPPKMYPGLWHPPIDTPVDYPGPYPLAAIDIKYNGFNGEQMVCPDNYPSRAPRAICGHISFVELDSQMTYQQALAWVMTGDERYANNVFRIVEGWADTNKEWGRSTQNGPLEAGWGCAAMAKALELLRDQAPAGLIDKFVNWIDTVITPQIDNFLDIITVKTVERHEPAYNNWHSTIAECEMSMGILTDNRTRYDRAVDVYHKTVKDYLRWGWGTGLFNTSRVVGECTETMRDIYHTEFGLGGLIQMAEMAWQQGEDLYSSNGHVLAAAMELHARIIRAAPLNNVSDSDMLPDGFKPFDAMPKPPAGCIWKFYTQTQLWAAINVTSGQIVAHLRDGVKYVVGNTFQPAGWEVGFNHFVGRLGMKLPETAAMLNKFWPEAYRFHWGLGTLSHAGTAADLWRAGIDQSVLCAAAPGGPSDEGVPPESSSPAEPSPADPQVSPAVPPPAPALPESPKLQPATPDSPAEPLVPAPPAAASPAVPLLPADSPAAGTPVLKLPVIASPAEPPAAAPAEPPAALLDPSSPAASPTEPSAESPAVLPAPGGESQ